MALTVPTFPPDFRYATGGTSTKNTIRAGLPVRSAHWKEMGKAVNWLHGRGSTLATVGPYTLASSSIAAGASRQVSAFVWPRYECTGRLWAVTLLTGATGGHSFGTITAGAYAADWAIEGTSALRAITTAYLQETVSASATPASAEITIANDAASSAGVTVLDVSLHELPRNELPADYGVDLSSLDGGLPIYAGGASDLSIESVHLHQRSAKTTARKSHLLSWQLPSGVSETGTSFVDLWDAAPYISCRLLESASTTREVAWTAFTSCPGAETGEIRLTAASGDTDTMSFTGAGAWQTPRTLTINTEDPTRWLTDGGKRGGTGDTVMAAIRRVSGGTSVAVLALAIGEAT